MDTLDRALALWRGKPSRGHAELVRRASWLVHRDDEALDLGPDPLDGRIAVGRFAELARRPSDPRIVDATIAMLETHPWFDWGALSADWQPLFQIFESGDASIAPRLRELAERERATTRMARRLAAKLDEIADALEARAEVDLPEARALADELAALEAKRRAIDEDSIALFDAVWAAPDDDAPRFVLADFLNEHTDPRGEFIALQLARGKVAAAARKREKKLLARNKRAWIGAIAPLVQVQDARFERGFIVGCRLKPHVELEMKFGDHPAWSTIREFTVHPLDVGTSMHLPLARMLRAFGAKMVESLTRGID